MPYAKGLLSRYVEAGTDGGGLLKEFLEEVCSSPLPSNDSSPCIFCSLCPCVPLLSGLHERMLDDQSWGAPHPVQISHLFLGVYFWRSRWLWGRVLIQHPHLHDNVWTLPCHWLAGWALPGIKDTLNRKMP